jgi:hypothetical protein
MWVFGADHFRPFGRQPAPISHGRRPGSREDADILNSDLELQSLALMVEVDGRRGVNLAIYR